MQPPCRRRNVVEHHTNRPATRRGIAPRHAGPACHHRAAAAWSTGP